MTAPQGSRFAVIFIADVRDLDDLYSRTAARMRDLALGEFGCLEFTSVAEGGREIAISYWAELEDIRAWKQHAEHRAAQTLGRERWYRAYRVQVVRIEREYGHLDL